MGGPGTPALRYSPTKKRLAPSKITQDHLALLLRFLCTLSYSKMGTLDDMLKNIEACPNPEDSQVHLAAIEEITHLQQKVSKSMVENDRPMIRMKVLQAKPDQMTDKVEGV